MNIHNIKKNESHYHGKMSGVFRNESSGDHGAVGEGCNPDEVSGIVKEIVQVVKPEFTVRNVLPDQPAVIT